jgi:hypothetical protein
VFGGVDADRECRLRVRCVRRHPRLGLMSLASHPHRPTTFDGLSWHGVGEGRFAPQGRVGSSLSSGIANSTGKNGVRDRAAPRAHPLKGSTVRRIVGRSDLAPLGRAARPGCADRRTRGCDGRRQDRRSMQVGFGKMFVGGSGGRVFAV